MAPPKRELEILEAVADGDDHETVGEIFGISAKSVRMSLVRTRERYGAGTTEEAIATALARKDIASARLSGRHLRLDQREVDVLNLVAQGLQGKKLAEACFASESWVDDVMATVFRKLKAVNRCNAVYIGYSAGFVRMQGRGRPRKPWPSEIDALVAISETADIEAAAKRLRIAPNTLKSSLRRITVRLDAKNTQHALAIALYNGEVPFTRTSPLLAQTLDQREREALVLMARGFKDSQIAARLRCSVRTVTRAVDSGLGKLKAKGRSNAVLILFQTGVLR